jgi:hypothetical protein
MSQPTMEYMLHIECSCGFLKYGNVKDDPSCVLESATGELRNLVNKHLDECRKPGTYLAYITPLFY